MAATLIHIKTKMLLPRDPEAVGSEEALEDPRAELVERLLEHQKFKSAAEFLHQKGQVEQGVYVRAPEPDDSETPEINATVFDLLTAFRDAMMRAQALAEIEIARDEVTLGQKLSEIRELLARHERFSVRELFERARSKRELVITFLALLELVKEAVIRITQAGPFGDIDAVRREPDLHSQAAE
jgi:segregation and condensation protein A